MVNRPPWQMRRDTSDVWAAKNPRLAQGEPVYEIDTGKLKVGNGASRWNDLPYFIPGSGGIGDISLQDLLEHVDSSTPHPIYDDGPSLSLLYENAKV